MGRLIEGKWVSSDVREGKENGDKAFIREDSSFRSQIDDKPAESGRYHLYLSYACPWAHRTMLMRSFKELQKHISISFVSPYMLDKGWSFEKDFDSIPSDPILGEKYLKDIYIKVDPNYSGRVTVPVLFDKEKKTIINNESAEIIRILNKDFNHLTSHQHDYYPQEKQESIDQWNEDIYHNINNGVYKCGFARSQKAYEQAFDHLFTALDRVENQLAQTPYICGDKISEADLRLLPTLIRFDNVYHTHFKCNGRLICQYQNLNNYLQRFLQMPQVSETINYDHAKAHYYYSHDSINPSRIVAKGPILKEGQGN